jgi:membrane protein implicated in regulation of membrane protease activity
METSTVWWLLAGSFVALELVTGTFYLLMLAIGMAAGAIVSSAGFGTSAQFVVSALIAIGAVGGWHWFKSRKKIETDQSNHDVHLDIGSTVEVSAWSASGSTSVMHRGASWSARHSQYGLADSSTFKVGWYRIVALDGNTLVLSPI